MDITQPPKWLLDSVPEGLKSFLESGGWWAVLGFAALVVLLLFWAFCSKALGLFGGRASAPKQGAQLEEHLGDYPPLKSSAGDRRLLVENVPVRLRLLVVAPAGKADEVDEDNLDKLLEKILPGLGLIFKADKPRVRVWPVQLSYEGFTKHLHRNTIVPEGEGELSPWIIVAGRAKFGGKQQIMIGLALQAVKPTTVGRLTIEAHEWPTTLRVKVRD